MSNVLIEKNKLDVLATAISNKSGEPLKLTLDEMVEAVDGIETGGGGITPTGNITITESGTTDVTDYATATVPMLSQERINIGYQRYFDTVSGQRKWRTTPIFQNSGNDGAMVDAYAMYSGTEEIYNAIPTGTTITPTTSSQTIGGANYMMEGAVTVAPIPYADGDNEAYGTEIWLINATPTVLQSKNWSVDFISNGDIYKKINLGFVMEYPEIIYAKSSNTEVYFNGTWTNQAYRTIEITGGTDKDNAEFRAWLEANAVRQ